jgi:hypothetical protein
VWVSGSKTGGLRSPSTCRRPRSGLRRAGRLGQHLADGVGIEFAVLALAERLVEACTSNRLKTWSRTLLL